MAIRSFKELERMKEICKSIETMMLCKDKKQEEFKKLLRVIGINGNVINSKMIHNYVYDLSFESLKNKVSIIQGLITVANEYYEVGANPAFCYKQTLGREVCGLVYEKTIFWTPNNTKEGMEIFNFKIMQITDEEHFLKQFKRNALKVLIY